MKKAATLLITAALLLGGADAASPDLPHAKAAPPVTIMLDDYPLPFPAAPYITKGTTMVPFRAIAEALGIEVRWNQSLRQITATEQSQNNTTVVLQVGSHQARVNGAVVALPIAPITENGHTLIPLSFFSQQFGAGIGWDQQTRTVSITSPRSSMYTLAFYALSSFEERAMLPGFSAVAFGWSRIDREGQYTTTGAEYRWPRPAGNITPESLVADAASGGTLPSLMVYAVDGAGELTRNLEDNALQEKTINGIMETALTKGFKGVTLDMEGLGWSGDKAKARADYNAFVRNLSERTQAEGLKLSVVAHPLNGAYSGYDYATLGELADELIIMAYPYEGGKQPEPMDKVNEAIQLALAETPREKLVLGLSLDSENADSVNAKIGLAKRYNLKGIAIWRLGIIGNQAWEAMQRSIIFNN